MLKGETRQIWQLGQRPNASKFDTVGPTLRQKNKEQEKVRFEGSRGGWMGWFWYINLTKQFGS